MPPNPRPIPRFIADTHPGGDPARPLRRAAAPSRSAKACDGDRGPARRASSCRARSTGSPSAPGAAGSGCPARPGPRAPEGELELFGHVSYVQPRGGRAERLPRQGRLHRRPRRGQPGLEDRPQRRRDRPLARRERPRRRRHPRLGPAAGRAAPSPPPPSSTRETVDQEAISNGRFTLIALDALEGYGDDIFMQVKLWSRRAQELASESLYDLP